MAGSSSYKTVHEHLRHLEKLFIMMTEDDTWSTELNKAILRKSRVLLDELKAFSGESSDEATMEFIG